MQDLRCSESTPSQRLAAAARRERQQRFERSAISRVHDIVELPVDKTHRIELPITPEPVPEPEPDAIEQWTERQKAIHKPLWFGIIDEIDPVEKKIGITDIQRVVCKYFGISLVDMLSRRREGIIVLPRQIAMYLSKTLTLKSLPEIGRRFGDKDHTTILHAVRKIAAMVENNNETRTVVAILKLNLGVA